LDTTVNGRPTSGGNADSRMAESMEGITPLESAHVDPAIRPLLNNSDLERVTYLLKDIYIRHPAAQRIEQFLGHLIRLPRKHRMPGLFVCAPSGQGKTHVLRAFQRLYPETHQPDGKRVLPILYGSVPASPTVHALDAMLYAEANLPSAAWPSRMLLNERLRRALSALGTRMIAIDEVHNLEHVKRRQVLHDWVRGLSNDTQLPVVLAGTEEFEPALLADPQLRSRFFVVRLPVWEDDANFQAFLSTYERACPLRSFSRLTAPSIRQALLHESAGITDHLMKCLSSAAIAAIRLKRERITEDLLPWWRDPPLLTDLRESPEALAHAWLGDTRVAPDPLPLATDGMISLRGSGRRTWLKSAVCRS